MAMTKKNMLINERKNAIRREIEQCTSEIIAACSKVPAIVLAGSAQLAVAWRDAAESSINLPDQVGKSLTETALDEALKARRSTLSFLVSPFA